MNESMDMAIMDGYTRMTVLTNGMTSRFVKHEKHGAPDRLDRMSPTMDHLESDSKDCLSG